MYHQQGHTLTGLLLFKTSSQLKRLGKQMLKSTILGSQGKWIKYYAINASNSFVFTKNRMVYLSRLAICLLAPFCHVRSAEGDFTGKRSELTCT